MKSLTQEMAEIIRAYKATSSVRGGELEVYTTGDVASFYRAAGSHGMLVMVNTANESVQVKYLWSMLARP